MLYEIEEDFTFTDLYITDYQECEVTGNKGVIVSKSLLEDGSENSKGFYICFESEGYLLYCNVSDDVTDDELKNVMKGVTLTEGTSENHTISSPLVNLTKASQDTNTSNMTFDYTENYICIAESENADFSSKDFTGTITVDGVEILDNISTLNQDKFYLPNTGGINEFADESGNILPTEKGTYQSGDGVNSLNKEDNQEQVNRKLVYATFTVTNTTDTDSYIFLGDFQINWLKNQSGVLTDIYKIDSSTPDIGGEMDYFDAENRKLDDTNNSHYYHIPANNSAKIKVGYFVDEDIIDELYITLPKQEIIYQLQSANEPQVFDYIAVKVQ